MDKTQERNSGLLKKEKREKKITQDPKVIRERERGEGGKGAGKKWDEGKRSTPAPFISRAQQSGLPYLFLFFRFLCLCLDIHFPKNGKVLKTEKGRTSSDLPFLGLELFRRILAHLPRSHGGVFAASLFYFMPRLQ